ncbi:hypothetical protein D3C73_884440 [compost metagenome]
MLLALHITREATDTVVHDHDVRFQALDQVVQCLQRRNDAAGSHVDIGAEGGNAFLRVRFRIGVHGDVRLVHVRDHGIGNQLLAGLLLVDHRLFGDQDRHRGTLRIVILARHVEDVGADDLSDIGQDLSKPVGVVLFIDVFNVTLTLLFGARVTHVIDVEAQRLGEVVETLQPQARQRLDHGGRFLCKKGKGELCGISVSRGNVKTLSFWHTVCP